MPQYSKQLGDSQMADSAAEMYPHPDSLRSRYAPQTPRNSSDKPQLNATPRYLPCRGTLPIASPMLMSSRISTPRDPSNAVAFKDRVNNFTKLIQQRSGPCSARDLERNLLQHGITPVYQPENWANGQAQVPHVAELPDVLDVRSFVSRPAPKECGPIQCYIRRRFTADWIFPRYELYMSEGDRFLLSAMKRKKSMTSYYIISLDPDDISKKTGNFFGKIRSNFLGTEFCFYDRGARCALGKSVCLTKGAEVGTVTYEKNVLGLRGPRKMTTIIPALSPDDGKPYAFEPILASSSSRTLLTKYRSGQDLNKMLVLRNKRPVWNKERNAYCLNFQGRVNTPSANNFQLASEADPDHIVLQFGKIGNGLYNLDYQYPMTALQAFATCLTSLDYKLACE